MWIEEDGWIKEEKGEMAIEGRFSPIIDA